MAPPPRDKFPNAYVGDLVPNGDGWTVVSTTYCPNWHGIEEPGSTQRCLPCACGTRHHMWTCHCGASVYAPKLRAGCKIINGPSSAYESQRSTSQDRGIP